MENSFYSVTDGAFASLTKQKKTKKTKENIYNLNQRPLQFSVKPELDGELKPAKSTVSEIY